MNDRIRELAQQAGLSHMPSNYSDMADLYKGADFELEKFAELIVKECIKVLDTNNAGLTLDAKWDAIYEIEQYFGVDK